MPDEADIPGFSNESIQNGHNIGLSMGPVDGSTGIRVVVVGGKTGIGPGLARAAGATVVFANRRISSVEERPELAGFLQVSLDIRDESPFKAAFDTIGSPDHMVVTTVPRPGHLERFHGCRHAGGAKTIWRAISCLAKPALALGAASNAGGSITFLTGGMGTLPKIGLTAVTDTLAVLKALSGSLELKLAPTWVNTICPGFTKTDIWSFLPAEYRNGLGKKVEERSLARRAEKSQDIGHAVLFLMTNPTSPEP